MPILDFMDEFTTSGGQAITATAIGTKVKDAGAAIDWGAGDDIHPYLRVGTAFNNLTSLQIDIIADTAADLVTSPTVLSTKTVLLAALTAGALIALPPLLPGASKEFLGAKFTVTGTAPTTGTVTCGLLGESGRVADGINYM